MLILLDFYSLTMINLEYLIIFIENRQKIDLMLPWNNNHKEGAKYIKTNLFIKLDIFIKKHNLYG